MYLTDAVGMKVGPLMDREHSVGIRKGHDPYPR